MCQHPPQFIVPTVDSKVVACGSCGSSFTKPEPSDADIEALARILFVSLQD